MSGIHSREQTAPTEGGESRAYERARWECPMDAMRSIYLPQQGDHDMEVAYPVPHFSPAYSSSYGPPEMPALCGARTSSSLSSGGAVWGGGDGPMPSPFAPCYPPLTVPSMQGHTPRSMASVHHGGDSQGSHGSSSNVRSGGADHGRVEQGKDKRPKDDSHTHSHTHMHRATQQLLQAARQADTEDAPNNWGGDEREDEEPPSIGELRRRRSSQGSSTDGMLVNGWSLANCSINSSNSTYLVEPSHPPHHLHKGSSVSGLGLCNALVMPEAGGGMLEGEGPLASPNRGVFTPLGSLGSLGSSSSSHGDERSGSPSPGGFAPVLDPRDTYGAVGHPSAPNPAAFATAHAHNTDASTANLNSMAPRYPPMPPPASLPSSGCPAPPSSMNTGAFRPLAAPPAGWGGPVLPAVPHFGGPYVYPPSRAAGAHNENLAVAARSVSGAMPQPPPQAPSSSSGSGTGSQRGSYKCGRCGGPKRNHVCPMLIERATKTIAIQVDREVTVGVTPGMPYLPCPPYKLLNVTPRAHPPPHAPPQHQHQHHPPAPIRPHQQVSL